MGLGFKVLGTGISTNYHLAIASANNEPPHPPNKTYFPDYNDIILEGGGSLLGREDFFLLGQGGNYVGR